MPQLTVDDLEHRECRSCGKHLNLAPHKRGRYRYLCEECRSKRQRARKEKTFAAFVDRVKADRLSVLQTLGAKCAVCGRPKPRLELHHKKYEVDSMTPKVHKESRLKGWSSIINEAKSHPERFALLCNSCHKFVTWIEKEPAILSRLLVLVERERQASR